MKRKISLIILSMVLCVTALLGLSACETSGGGVNADEDFKNRGEWSVQSPDGSIAVNVSLDAYNNLKYSVKKGDTQIVRESDLGMDIQEDDLSFITLYKKSEKNIKGSYDNITGKSTHVDYTAKELTLTFKAWEFYLDVIMRAYDDGYAFRYNIRKIDGTEGTMTVNTEKTTFVLPENSNMWAQEYVSISPSKGNFFAYEVAYQKWNVSEFNSSQYMAMPAVYNVPGTDYYSMVTESELIGSNYYGSYLKTPKGSEGTYTLKTEHTPAGITVDDNKVSYPFESPWRVGIVGDMKTVQESNLVETVYYSGEEDYTDVYWKPDNYDELSAEEQAIYNYDWVEPGLTAWSWLVYHSGTNTRAQSDINLHYEYLTLAKEMGWKYVLLDGGWTGCGESNLKTFMAEAARQNIKVLVWCNALTDFGNGNADILESKLDLWKSWGASGIKIDFFDGQNATDQKHQGEDIGTIKWYETVYQECAKRQMVVNCHGSNKPTGERSKYPNVVNREGIYGNEMTSVGATFTINELFIRNLVGPSDFTPVVNPLSGNLTKAHQLSLSVLFEAGTPSMADYAKAYKDDVVNSLFKTIPSAREKTVFLGGELDLYYSAAIKGGDYWFVGVANSLLKRDVEIDFSFLDENGEYVAEVYSDSDDLSKLEKEVITVTKNDVKTFSVKSKGGLVIRLYKK